MSNIQNITNTPPDSGAGDNLKVAFDKVNENFIELNETKLEDAPIDNKQYVRENGDWVEVNIDALDYDGNSPSTRSIEEIPAGTDITQFTITQLIENIYAPFIAPTFNSFSISGQNTLIEVGTLFGGNKTFLWNTTNAQNIQADSITIKNTTDNIVLGSDLENDGLQVLDIGTIVNTSPRTTVFSISATNTKNSVFNRNYQVESIYPFYHFRSNSPISASQMVTAINNSTATKVVAKSDGTISIPYLPNGEYIAVAYPASSPTKTRWYATELSQGDIPGGVFGAVVVDTLANGVEYKIHITPILTNNQVAVMQLRNN
jgi:hypothetical protein